jgi:hypothetical protein
MVVFWLVEVQLERNSLMRPIRESAMGKLYIVISDLVRTWVANHFSSGAEGDKAAIW